MSFAKPAFPIAVSATGTHFVDAAQKPFFWLGDTAWPLLSEYPKDDAKAYITRRAEQGFTVIQTVFSWGRQTDGPVGRDFREIGPSPNPEGELPWHGTPPVANPKYFDWAEELIRHAESQGVALLVIGLWGNYVVERKLFDAGSAYDFGLFLGNRFAAARNLLWMNGGDRLPTGYEAVWRAYAKGVRDGGGKQLMTYHPTGSQASSYFWHDEDWLDFNFTQTWGSWSRIYSITVADRLRLPPKPTVLGEPAYEDGPEYPTGPITPNLVRKQALWAYFAGGGFTYGHNLSWRMDEGWRESVNAPGALNMGTIRKILESRPWHEMLPDQSVLYEAGSFGRSLRAALRTPDRRRWLIFLPEPGILNVYIDRCAGRQVQATWIDVRTGAETDAGIHETQYEQGVVFPPFEDIRTLKTPRHAEETILALDSL